VVTPEQRRAVVTYAVESAAISECTARRFLAVHRSLVRYHSKRPCELELRKRLRALAAERPRWGSPRLRWLLRREGLRINPKKVERRYREEGLAARRRSRRRVAQPRAELPEPGGADERWSMDFMRDTLASGRAFRTSNRVDDFTRECLVIEVDFSLGGDLVVQVLERLHATRGLPRAIVLDNGPEFTGQALDAWARRRGVQLQFIRPGKPVEDAFIESFNGRFRDECLTQHWFLGLADARRTIERWRQSYSGSRPHRVLGGLTPAEFVRSRCQVEESDQPRL
jgi:putative transposase